MKKILKVLTAGMLALALTFGLMTTAVAAPGDGDAVETSEAAITKLLRVPVGTSLPASMEFTFEFEPVSYNDGETTADLAKLPIVGNANVVSIVFSGTVADLGTAGGVTTYYKESDSLFEATMFDQAGVYVWEITETANTYTVQNTATFKDKVEYSKAVYTVRVYVNEVAGDLEIAYIGVVKTTTDAGASIPETNQVKVDPTPGDPNDPDYTHSQFAFTNGYEKTPTTIDPIDPDPTDPDDWTFYVSKAVTGDFIGTSVIFDFSLTLTIPSLVVSEVRSCDAFIVEKVGSAYVLVDDNPITFVSGTPKAFQLSQDQFLVFVNAPIGTGYAVTEAGHTGYTPSVEVIYTPADGIDVKGAASAAVDQPLALPHASVPDNLLFVGENGSSVAFTNDRGDVTPMGIIMADLPIIALVLLSAAALIGLAAIRARISKEKKNAQASVSVNSLKSN